MTDWIAREELRRVLDNLRVVGANLSEVAVDAESSLPMQDYPKNVEVGDLTNRIGSLIENMESLITQGETMLEEVESELAARDHV